MNSIKDTSDIHGTPSDIKIYTEKGLQLAEKACVAYHRDTSRIIAVGNEAWEYVGKDSNIVVASPLQEGCIVDFMIAEKMFRFLIKRIKDKPRFRRIKNVAVIVEDDLNRVAEKVFEEALNYAEIDQITFLPVNEYKTEKDYMSLTDRYRMVLVIGVKEPEEAIIEKFKKIITYAQKKGISPEQLEHLWEQLH